MGPTGDVSGHMGSYLGELQGGTYHDMQWVALWMLIIDPGMINEIEG